MLIPTERYCEHFKKDVTTTVRCTVPAGLNNAIPTRIECSASPNGRCGKCDTCPTLKEALDEARNVTVR